MIKRRIIINRRYIRKVRIDWIYIRKVGINIRNVCINQESVH